MPSPASAFAGLCAALAALVLGVNTAAQSPLGPAAAGDRSGEVLARTYCQTCHLFPEPKLLDQYTWMRHSLRLMGYFLGIGQVDLEGRPDEQILRNAKIYPDAPLISQQDWLAILKYYDSNAPVEPVPQPPRATIRTNLAIFTPHPVAYMRTRSTCCLVRIEPKSKRIFAADWRRQSLDVLDEHGVRGQSFHLPDGPISILAHQGTYYATLIGRFFPSDEPLGKLVSWPASDSGAKLQTVLTNLPRPVHLQIADLNGDGQEDLVLCLFGNKLGRFSWFEKTGTGYREHVLIDRPGAIRAEVVDVNKDGRPDLIVLMAQAREGLFLLINQGNGVFTTRPLIEEHPLFGFSHFELHDFNGDGFPDILATNGDNGEYASPPKSYHGVRIYLNDGQWNFKEAWFYPLNGAYKAMAADFDQDGDLDIAAISYFPDYTKSPEESFVYLENLGGLKFEASTFAECTAGRWLTMDVGDLNGDGRPEIVLASFSEGPLTTPIPASLQELWATNRLSLMLLENTGKTRVGVKEREHPKGFDKVTR